MKGLWSSRGRLKVGVGEDGRKKRGRERWIEGTGRQGGKEGGRGLNGKALLFSLSLSILVRRVPLLLSIVLHLGREFTILQFTRELSKVFVFCFSFPFVCTYDGTEIAGTNLNSYCRSTMNWSLVPSRPNLSDVINGLKNIFQSRHLSNPYYILRRQQPHSSWYAKKSNFDSSMRYLSKTKTKIFDPNVLESTMKHLRSYWAAETIIVPDINPLQPSGNILSLSLSLSLVKPPQLPHDRGATWCCLTPNNFGTWLTYVAAVFGPDGGWWYSILGSTLPLVIL